MGDQTRRDYYDRRRGQLDMERSSFIAHYKDLSEYNSPRKGRFEMSDRNKGTKKHKAIINNKGMRALTTATAGMFAGVMSPTRPWFSLATPDPELTQFQPVKLWLRQVELSMRSIFNAGNLYTMAPTMIHELLNFGTGCMTHVDDDENLARFYAHTPGSYYIGQNDKLEVSTLVREYEMTTEQLAIEFGEENLSQAAKNNLSRNELGAWHKVVHFIEPNDDYRPNNPLAKNKLFSSVKYELGNIDKNVFLSQGGFDEFPAYVPRWSLTGEDIYGTDCPGMQTLGDIKSLQIEEKRKGQAIDKQVNPPLQAPPSVRNVPISSLPGGLNIYDGGGGQKIESIYNVTLDLRDLKEDMARIERRIDESFFVDLFLAISNMEGVQPRNQMELSERNSERLLQLGPVLERMQGEFLDPLISRTFNQMLRANLVPPAPDEIQGQPLKVEYISSLAQAQRAVDTRGIERLTQYQAGLVQAGLSDGKKFNSDAAVQEYANLVGTPPQLISPDEQVAAQRQQEAEAAQIAQQMELAGQAAAAGAAAGQIDLDGNNPVSAVVNNG
tara:strand:+ start:2807 stop:4468 length:1662 start_codon:yes stop_codon:yes gene_type:complete